MEKNLAEILKQKSKPYNISVDVSSFEEWEPEYLFKTSLIFSATAFHWINYNVRYRKCYDLLKENGYIAILKSGTSNIYAINDSVYWKSWGNKKQYSKFPANILLALSEQEESLQTKLETVKHKEITTKSNT